ncbi:MAG: serine hydrolase domain-containing protein [Bacteroidota bacterium]
MMKRIFLPAIFALLNSVSFSQSGTQQLKIDSVKNIVVDLFNKKDADGLYGIAGAAFRKELSPETFKKISDENLFPLGKINETKFESNKNNINKYKVTFQAVVLSMYISLDSADKLETFLFQPYKDDNAKKTIKPATTNPLVTAMDKKVDEVISPYINQLNSVGVSVGILKNGKAYFYNYGETAKGNNKLPTENTIYEIGSISKTFTAILLADAVNSGKVKLDDPVNKYLPDSIGKLEYEGVPVTLKTLSNHSSGLPRLPSNLPLDGLNGLNPYKNYDVPALFSFLKNYKLTRKPGEVYEYSNLAVGLLGTIMERVNKKPYEELLIEKILTPLQMNDTRILMRKADSIKIAKGYDENGVPSSQWDFKALAGAGGIRSTVKDLVKYAAANITCTNKNLNEAIQLTHTITFQPPAAKVALGWHIIKPGNDDVIFHNGGTGGFRTYLAINPAKKNAVVIFSNSAISDDNEGNALIKWLETQ